MGSIREDARPTTYSTKGGETRRRLPVSAERILVRNSCQNRTRSCAGGCLVLVGRGQSQADTREGPGLRAGYNGTVSTRSHSLGGLKKHPDGPGNRLIERRRAGALFSERIAHSDWMEDWVLNDGS